MPNLEINGTQYFYRDEGEGDQVLVFAHGLLFSSEMFRKQIEYFKKNYRCISIDFKGQGKSGVGKDGYDMDTLTDEVQLILKTLNLKHYHFIGLSMGGFVGMRLALRVPQELISLILLNTTAEEEPKKNIPKYNKLNFIARWFGLKLVINKVMPIVFAEEFMTDEIRKEEKEYWKQQIVKNHKIGITKAVKGVIYRNGVDREIQNITTPTLILVGEFDTATVPSLGKKINNKIHGSKLLTIPGAGHSSTIENPEQVNKSIEGFLHSLRLNTSIPGQTSF